MVEFVGTVLGRGVVVAATLSFSRSPTRIFGAGAAVKGWGVVIEAGSELVWGTIAGWLAVAIDPSSFGRRGLRSIQKIRGRLVHGDTDGGLSRSARRRESWETHLDALFLSHAGH